MIQINGVGSVAARMAGKAPVAVKLQSRLVLTGRDPNLADPAEPLDQSCAAQHCTSLAMKALQGSWNHRLKPVYAGQDTKLRSLGGRIHQLLDGAPGLDRNGIGGAGNGSSICATGPPADKGCEDPVPNPSAYKRAQSCHRHACNTNLRRVAGLALAVRKIIALPTPIPNRTQNQMPSIGPSIATSNDALIMIDSA